MSGSAPTSGIVDPTLALQRRVLVAQSPHLCGLDRAELVAAEIDRCTIDLHFIASVDRQKRPIPPDLRKDRISIRGNGPDARVLKAVHVRRHAHDATRLSVDFPPIAVILNDATIDKATVSLRDDAIDPLLSTVAVRFAGAGTLGRDPIEASPSAAAPPATDVTYLAKDFESYRQMMLDQITALQPDWTERHPADMGNAIVEILAYAADSLSYYQDAVATEAYLSTARRRVSLRRHARLLDYPIHDGCAARIWAQIKVSEPGTLKAGLALICDAAATWNSSAVHVASRMAPPTDGLPVFETIGDAALHPEHNQLDFYDWGTDDFRLPPGTTSAALIGRLDKLEAGDVLILAELLDPMTGDAAAADSALRHAIRLDQTPRFMTDPLTGATITKISWAHADALPFELSVVRSSGGNLIRQISGAFGNIVPADSGVTVTDPILVVPEDDGVDLTIELAYPGVIHAVPLDLAAARKMPAAAFAGLDPFQAIPAVSLRQQSAYATPQIWLPVRDLLGSDRFASQFVAETEADGVTTLRFGDNRNGAVPPPGAILQATYRIGTPDANVGADSLRSWSPRVGDEFVVGVRNLLPAAGGTAAQSAEQIRLHAPNSFRSQRRCVIPEDYVEALTGDARVRAAVCEERWTGSWNTTLVYVQPEAGLGTSEGALLRDLSDRLEPLRIIGGAYLLRAPRYVPIEIVLAVTAKTPFSPATVERHIVAGIRSLLGFGTLTFGQTVYLSPIIAIAMAEPGVTDAQVLSFQRYGKPAMGELKKGQIDFGRLEIPLLDDQPVDGVRGHLRVRVTVGDSP